ncbi:DUF2142 domain-containing protein [Methylobacterium sp. J-026]|uniref:DUF2142 domain-containing protein n=1 Tax=Methylobacterium sp. J-026 TaxID=2836624 RepID=UPI001FBB72D6|nr:DUF2142 domain-containing protein [Methylobacterium sp. J-026]MCJ2136921.1 DUF2142 domain-containing protein [Methylobacterium sp. J-026]
MTLPFVGGGRFWCLSFLCLGLPVSVALALIVPLGEVADEAGHLARAAALAQGQWVGHRANVPYADGTVHRVAGVTLDSQWDRLARSRPLDFGGTLAPSDTAGSDGNIFIPLHTIATYPPLLYAPGALGLSVGDAFDLDPATTARLGRLANIVAYMVLGLAALAYATRGRAALFALLCLPMSLSLAASFSQDGLIIALAALAAALLTPWSMTEQGARCRLFGAALAITAIVWAKPPYAPIAAMLLISLPLARRDGRFYRRRLSLMALTVIPALLWTVIATVFVAAPVPRPTYEAGPLWSSTHPALFNSTDPTAQARVLVSAPLRFITVPAKFVFNLKHLIVLAEGMVGIFGWYDQPLPGALYVLWGCSLFIPLLIPYREPLPSWSERILLVASVIFCCWLIVVSQYLSWTNVGEERVYGPQGRYLLPLVPLLILAFARRRTGRGPAPDRFTYLPIVAAMIDVLAVPAFYLRF